jgi:uncharacterized protein YcfJ
MKALTLSLVTAALFGIGGNAVAQYGPAPDTEVRSDVARVLDVDPIRVNHRPGRTYQECWNDRADRYDSGYYRDDRGRLYREKDDGTAGAVVGALIGGVLGNQVGDGKGRTAATIAGAVAGGAIGKRADENDFFRYRDDRGREVRCRTVTEHGRGERAFRVVYEYAGATYETITRRHPGRSLPIVVQIRPQDEYVAQW